MASANWVTVAAMCSWAPVMPPSSQKPANAVHGMLKNLVVNFDDGGATTNGFQQEVQRGLAIAAKRGVGIEEHQLAEGAAGGRLGVYFHA